MRRRTNKSSKVPNVKLRPAPSAILSRWNSERCLAEDSQLGSDDTTFMDFCPRPFKGVVLCATGIKDKSSLFKKAVELGAVHVFAFTDKVTHLIAEAHGGAKYICALERKIPIMKPSWIEESYEVWLRGDDVDLQDSLAAHRLPVFTDVVLCVSGIADVQRRTQINRLVTENGGTYVKNIERPVKVTHLLCSGDDETDKMRYAEKFNKRKEASIRLVWEEWFWDSFDFGGRFDEARYEASRPRPERKVLPEAPATSPPRSEFPSEMDETSVPLKRQSTSNNQDEDDEGEMATVKVLPAVTLQIWGSLLSRRGYQVSGTELVRTTSAPAVFGAIDESPEFEAGKSVISAFRRANSFAPCKLDETEGGSTSRQPFRRATTSGNVFVKSATPLSAIPKNGESSTSAFVEPVAGPSNEPLYNRMFVGYKFLALGEAKTSAVRNAVESYGGQMASESDEEADFIIVRLVSGSKLYREEADPNLRSKYRTECWLERCIFEDQVCPPDKDISFIPLAIEVPIPDAEKVVLSLSGFDQSESCGLRRLVRALGITLAPNFSKRTTHLLCPSGTGPKFEKAIEWGKPVVKMSWLAAIASTGVVPLDEEHIVSRSTLGVGTGFDFGVPMEVDIKGKGKAKAIPQDLPPLEIGKTMNDITNADTLESPLGTSKNPDFPSRKRQPPKPIPQTSHSSASSVSISFGQPKYGLGSVLVPPTRLPSLVSVPPQSGSSSSPASALPPHIQQSIQQESFTQSDYSPAVPGASSGSSINEIPRPTWQEVEQERLTVKIPSSRTPSPMKLSKKGSRTSLSPVKIDHEATKALQESITRALKRHTSEEDEVLNGGRSSKRQRPHRQKKALTRQLTEQETSEISVDSNPIHIIPFAASTISPFESFDVAEDDMLPIIEPAAGNRKSAGKHTSSRRTKSSAVGGSVEPEEEQSMRVTYEDPGLADERKKLMRLLKSQNQESPSKAPESTRRSTRVRKNTKS
ncbi:hypothetical protein P691DRAFT_725915 [Macrolepiota fuliginosa MF-IS2]|uniref:BRCT domain-containing protein n=1 Tax=Macrolepiota fuliginosa MF-IS2 TaxID=1400762 RepID=A0A9P5XJR1_9AGAR|nr:hypothetical protein P691DRAFT_725915 [Macrolepiota fuliginosa MF-IS2]